MHKKIITSLLVSLAIALTSCNKGKKPQTYSYDRTYFNGICALSGEFNNGVDYALTNDWTASKVGALKAKSCRLWIALSGLFTVGDNDDLHLNQHYYLVMKDHIDKLKAVGVENFLLMVTAFVYPTGYIPTTGYVVPDPNEEYEEYIRFLNLQAEGCKQIKKLFPEIKNFEPGNEPDFACPGCIHKNGFVFGGDMSVNYNFVYNDTDKTSIIADLCWYVRRAVREVDPEAKVSLTGLTNQGSVPEFLDLIYKRIESKCLPAGQEKSDIDPDNYFDILNWHPYPTQVSEDFTINWDKWVEQNKGVYQIAINHNDEGKEVYFSELGWTDFGVRDEVTLNRIAGYYTDAIKCVKDEMPWVTAVFAFRLTNLVHQPESAGEQNFGLFYNPDDPITPAKAKPAAYAVAKAFNGEDYDLDANL